MYSFIETLFDSRVFLKVNSFLGIFFLVCFLIYFFSKEGRDERGKKTIAISALVAFIALFVVLNILPTFLDWSINNYVRMLNLLQISYSLVLLSADISILIARKLKIM